MEVLNVIHDTQVEYILLPMERHVHVFTWAFTRSCVYAIYRYESKMLTLKDFFLFS